MKGLRIAPLSKRRNKRLGILFGLVVLFALSVAVALANQLKVVPASPLLEAPICKPGYTPDQCLAAPFDTSQDFAFQENGFAQKAVARDNVPGLSAIHQPEFANDGYYGNGTSWISNSPNSWLKIDLGRTILIDRLTLGRDRLSSFDDRDPGQFTVAVALSDNVYANGDDSDDSSEYSQIFASASAGFSGVINGRETLQASFEPVSARFVKLTFANYGTAIDEVEIFGAIVVDIDVIPGSDPNSINPTGEGIIPVAILTTATFDATAIDPLTVRFGPAGASEEHCQAHTEDVDGDRTLDLLFHFPIEDTGLKCGDNLATLTGQTMDGLKIVGVDLINTIGCQ